MLLLDAPLTEQPQEAVEVNDGHPSSRGFIAGFVGTPSAIGAGFTPVGAVGVRPLVGRSGLTNFDGASFVELTGAPRITGGPFTALVGVIYGGQARPYTFISQGGSSVGYGWKLGCSPSGTDGRFQLTYGLVEDYPQSSASIPQNVPVVIGATISGDGGTCRYYIDGKQEGSTAVGTMISPSTRDLTLGASHRGGEYIDYLGAGNSIWLALVWNRELSAEEVAAISANPWQLFRTRHVVLPASAAPAADVAGAASLALTATGSIAIAKPVSGAVAVALTTSGSIAVAKPVAGAASLALNASGAIAIAKPVAGAATCSVSATGSIAVAKPVGGAATLSATAAGSVAVDKPVAGAAQLALTSTGTLTTVGMGGAATCSLAATGNVAVSKPVSGAAAIALTAAGAASIAKPVAGNAALALAASGSVAVAKPVAGAASLALVAGGSVAIAKPVSGAAGLTLTANGAVAVPKPLGGAAALSLAATGRLFVVEVRGLVTAILTWRSIVSTTLTARAETDATLTQRQALAAHLTGRPEADATLAFQSDDPVP
ncbi:MAG: hypothetical protein K2Y26_17955 [Gemmatimonadaceae bacterium]|nr:hypothetical protein [Gemmatimonadaceae bacterium]